MQMPLLKSGNKREVTLTEVIDPDKLLLFNFHNFAFPSSLSLSLSLDYSLIYLFFICIYLSYIFINPFFLHFRILQARSQRINELLFLAISSYFIVLLMATNFNFFIFVSSFTI